MARSRREEAVRDELRREEELLRPQREADEDVAGDPERPDAPLGVPKDADPEERPGFPRDDPSHG